MGMVFHIGTFLIPFICLFTFFYALFISLFVMSRFVMSRDITDLDLFKDIKDNVLDFLKEVVKIKFKRIFKKFKETVALRKKYTLTRECLMVSNLGERKVFLYRIKAAKSFSTVKKGELGGYIEKRRNLSQRGNCWIADDAMVIGNSRVKDNAYISGSPIIYGNVVVCGNAEVKDDAIIWGYDCEINLGDFSVVEGRSVIATNVTLGKDQFIRDTLVYCNKYSPFRPTVQSI